MAASLPKSLETLRSHSGCTDMVQRGVSPMLACDFELRGGLFHMVFNRTVENFHPQLVRLGARMKKYGARIARSCWAHPAFSSVLHLRLQCGNYGTLAAPQFLLTKHLDGGNNGRSYARAG